MDSSSYVVDWNSWSSLPLRVDAKKRMEHTTHVLVLRFLYQCVVASDGSTVICVWSSCKDALNRTVAVAPKKKK